MRVLCNDFCCFCANQTVATEANPWPVHFLGDGKCTLLPALAGVHVADVTTVSSIRAPPNVNPIIQVAKPSCRAATSSDHSAEQQCMVAVICMRMVGVYGHGSAAGHSHRAGPSTTTSRQRFLPRDAMHKRGICRHPVSVRPSRS